MLGGNNGEIYLDVQPLYETNVSKMNKTEEVNKELSERNDHLDGEVGQLKVIVNCIRT